MRIPRKPLLIDLLHLDGRGKTVWCDTERSAMIHSPDQLSCWSGHIPALMAEATFIPCTAATWYSHPCSAVPRTEVYLWKEFLCFTAQVLEMRLKPKPSLLCVHFSWVCRLQFIVMRHFRLKEHGKHRNDYSLYFAFMLYPSFSNWKPDKQKPPTTTTVLCYSFCSYWQWQQYEITALKLFSLTWKQIGTLAISEMLFLLIKRQFLWVTKPRTSGSKPGSLKRNLELCKHNRQGTQLK